MKLSLSKKLAFFIIIFIIITSVLTAISLFYITKGEIESLEKENLKNVALEQADDLFNYFSIAKEDLFMVAENNELVEYLSLDEGERDFQEAAILADWKRHGVTGRYLAMYLMDLNGVVWSSSDENFVNNNYSFRPYFKNAIKDGYAHDFAIGVTSKEVGYYFAKSIIGADGRILGVLVIKTRSDSLNNSLDFVSLETDSNVMLVDNFGVIIYSLDEDKLYKSLSKLSDTELQKISDSKRFDGLTIDALNYDLAHDFMRGDTQVGVMDIHDSYDDEDEVLAMAKISEFPYAIILEESADKFLSISIRIAKNISIILISFGVFMAFVIYLFINEILKPLSALKKGVEKIEEGDFSYRLTIRTNDELQDIGENFNSMAEKLQKNISSIENKIYERTASLEKLNAHMIGRELKMIELKRRVKMLENKNNK